MTRRAAQDFSNLRQRAVEALAAAGGELAGADLATRLFAGPARGPWQALLRTILEGDPRFVPTENGWQLAGSGPSDTLASGTFVALALAATGADPRRHRIARVSAVKVDAWRVRAHFDTVLNPGRRLPGYLQRALQVTPEQLDESPTFADIAGDLLDFVGNASLVGYGVAGLVSLLDAELRRARRPRLANALYELDELAPPRLEVDKPDLVSLARALGLQHPRPGFPPADALTTARAALAVFQERGPRPGPPLPPSRQAEPGALSRRIRDAEIPERPGVYIVEDARGRALYIGKSVNLRRRLGTYRSRMLSLERRLGGLAIRGTDLRILETPSDLEARLLEAELIARHRPPFNVQRSARPSALYIRAAPWDSIPSLRLAPKTAADGATYLGPFRSQRVARASLQLARAVFPACAPRIRRAAAARREAVLAAIRLLSGQKDEALASLAEAMHRQAGAGDQLGVERTRAIMRAVSRLEPIPSARAGASFDQPVLVLEPSRSGRRRAHLLHGATLRASGDVEASVDVSTVEDALAVVRRLAPRPAAPGFEDEAAIILRWQADLGPDFVILPLPDSALDAIPGHERPR